MSTVADKFPPQIKYIIGNEGCERFSFYGMRAILTIFMVQYLLISATDATAIYHIFVAACYLSPLAGGYLADRYFGKYKVMGLLPSVLVVLSLVYPLLVEIRLILTNLSSFKSSTICFTGSLTLVQPFQRL
ncbi:MAG: hypothetical protein MJK18_12310 [Bdellovibrionales bacterium]|nr:hypothetical protein [Bdellovibrionales bacterium]